MPEDIEETIIETEASPASNRIEEAENTAEIALDMVDDTNARLTVLEADLVALNERLIACEMSIENARSNDGNTITEPSDSIPEETRSSSEVFPSERSIIKPKREHPYYRKLW